MTRVPGRHSARHSRGGRRRRAVARGGAAALCAVLAAACGGGPAAGPGGPQSPYQQAVAYAHCMRGHGEPHFPDPDGQGDFRLTGPEVGPLNAPPYLTASRACQHLLPRTGPLTPAQKREHISEALRFAACMRAHGIVRFPDPIVGRGGGAVGFRMPGIDQNSPRFRSARQACRKYQPGAGGDGAP